MASSNLPTPTLQPLSSLPIVTDGNDLADVVDEGASCCGGGCCSTN